MGIELFRPKKGEVSKRRPGVWKGSKKRCF